MRQALLILLAMLLTHVSHAQDVAGESVAIGNGLLPMVLNLALVLAIIVLLGWFFSRSSRFGGRSDSGLDIVATRMVGNRERLIVVQVGDEQVLLGVTAQTISPLLTLDKPITKTADCPPLAGAFAERLAAMREKHTTAQEADS